MRLHIAIEQRHDQIMTTNSICGHWYHEKLILILTNSTADPKPNFRLLCDKCLF